MPLLICRDLTSGSAKEPLGDTAEAVKRGQDPAYAGSMARGSEPEPTFTPRGQGFLLGCGVCLVFFVALVIAALPWTHPDTSDLDVAFNWFLVWVALAILAVGYLGAIVMAVRRSTTHRGQGMLMGLTFGLICMVALVFVFADTGT
jgi:hypothetical protein